MSAANVQELSASVTSQTSSVQRLFVNGHTASIYKPKYGGGGVAPTFRKTIEVTPKDSDQKRWGTKSDFDVLHNITSYISDIRLSFDVEPPAANGSGGTYERLCDWAGFFAVRSVQMYFGSNLIQEITGEELLFQHTKLYEKEEKQEFIAKHAGGDLLDLEREALFNSSQHFVFKLPFYFGQSSSSALPQVLSQELKFYVNWANYSDVVQTDHTTKPQAANEAITNIKMEVETVAVSSNEMMSNGNSQQSQNGIQYSIRDVQSLEKDFTTDTSGVQEFSFELNAFNIATQALIFYIRPYDDINTPYANDPSFLVGNGDSATDVLELVSAKITASQRDITNYVSREYLQHHRWVERHPSPPGQKVFEIAFSLSPQSASTSTGTEIDFSNLSTPKLVLKFNTTVARKYTIDIKNIDRNVVQMRNGAMRKVFV